jgi:hypothetical protein
MRVPARQRLSAGSAAPRQAETLSARDGAGPRGPLPCHGQLQVVLYVCVTVKVCLWSITEPSQTVVHEVRVKGEGEARGQKQGGRE